MHLFTPSRSHRQPDLTLAHQHPSATQATCRLHLPPCHQSTWNRILAARHFPSKWPSPLRAMWLAGWGLLSGTALSFVLSSRLPTCSQASLSGTSQRALLSSQLPDRRRTAWEFSTMPSQQTWQFARPQINAPTAALSTDSPHARCSLLLLSVSSDHPTSLSLDYKCPPRTVAIPCALLGGCTAEVLTDADISPPSGRKSNSPASPASPLTI
jgi:hypothetical protein